MRQDIQCLRGIAIILVFLFHLCPHLFVNGFLGVDMFFVISGFLMAKNLSQSKLMSIKGFMNFYYRRFRRILPLYYFIIFVAVVMVHIYLGEFLWENNNRYSLASLFLVTNQLVIHDQADYFNEFRASLSSTNVFLHLWSLSVEMQFYLLVPFIFFGLQFLRNDSLKFLTVLIITVVGLIAFLQVHEKFAFNFMFLRLWQFSAGFMALFWTKMNANKYLKMKGASNENQSKYSEDLMIVCLSIIGGCLLPNQINTYISRPLVTFATSIIIASEQKNVQILQSQILSYLGDISYAIYLVHWPIITIFLTSTFKGHLSCILITALSSILIHHLYENKYLKMNWKTLVSFLFVLILGNVCLQVYVREARLWPNTYSTEFQEIVEKNKIMLSFYSNADLSNKDCVDSVLPEANGKIEVFGYCNYRRGNGNFSIMMVGNSYAQNLNPDIRAHFHNNYFDYRYISIGEGYGFYADSETSRIALGIFKKYVSEHRPDVLFISARYSPTIRSPIQPNDPYLQQMNENLEFLQMFVKKIYILDSHPLYNMNFMNFFLQYAAQRPSELESLHLNKKKADYEMRYVKKRFSMIKCKKCQFYDLSHVFVENDKYLTFDRDQMLSYVDNTVHITPAGIKLCSPVFEKITKEIINTL